MKGLKKREMMDFLFNFYFSFVLTYNLIFTPPFKESMDGDYKAFIESRIKRVNEYFDYDKNGIIDKPNEIDSLYNLLKIDKRFFEPKMGLEGLELIAYNVLLESGKIKSVRYDKNENKD